MRTLRAALLDKLILFQTLLFVTGVSRNDSVSRRPLVHLIGIPGADTSGDALRSDRNAFIAIPYEVVITAIN